MKFLSLFSGIEAASAAWRPLGWECCAVAEVEPFPCAVLAHHYPDAPNLGDITKITLEQITALGKIDLVVGGFPCQDVSVAGKRAGLKNDDGTATRSGLFFDAMRIVERANPRWTVIENVPGLFSSNGGADFAAVVGTMAGCEFDVPADGWRSSGVAIGPLGLVEWTVLDAQYHGLAQRRRRVFLVRDSGNWADRPPLFLEPYRLQGHPAPCREAGQEVTGTIRASAARRGGTQDECGYGGLIENVSPTISARTQGGGGLGTDFDLDGGLIHCPDIVPQAMSSKWSKGSSGPAGDEVANLVARSLRADGFDASEDGTGRGTLLVPVVFNLSGREDGAQPEVDEDGIASLRAASGGSSRSYVATVVHGTQDPCTDEHIAFALGRNNGQENAIAFSCKDHGADAGEVAPTLRSMGHDDSHANGGGQIAVAFHENQRAEITMNDTAGTLKCSGGKPGQGYPAIQHGMSVRRLTPVECSRLQGFEDDYLNILFRKKPAKDGPKYKSLGNSFATTVIQWIGGRIKSAEEYSA